MIVNPTLLSRIDPTGHMELVLSAREELWGQELDGCSW